MNTPTPSNSVAIDRIAEMVEYLEAVDQDYILVGGRKLFTSDLRIAIATPDTDLIAVLERQLANSREALAKIAAWTASADAAEHNELAYRLWAQLTGIAKNGLADIDAALSQPIGSKE